MCKVVYQNNNRCAYVSHSGILKSCKYHYCINIFNLEDYLVFIYSLLINEGLILIRKWRLFKLNSIFTDRINFLKYCTLFNCAFVNCNQFYALKRFISHVFMTKLFLLNIEMSYLYDVNGTAFCQILLSDKMKNEETVSLSSQLCLFNIIYFMNNTIQYKLV